MNNRLIYPKIILDLEKKYNLLINKKITGNSKELKEYKNLLPSLTNFQKEALIGLTLGDINLQKLSKNGDYRIRFEYGKINEEYALHLNQLFKHWVLSPPKSMERIIKKNLDNNSVKESVLRTLRFQTITHESFNFLGELFIKDKKKSVPSNLIKDHLTEVGLSYWCAFSAQLVAKRKRITFYEGEDDGGKLDYSKNEGKGLVFNTQNFSLLEVENMTNELKNKFSLSKCWVGINKNKPIIKISGNDYEKMLNLMTPYIIPSMLWKLPSNRKSKKK